MGISFKQGGLNRFAKRLEVHSNENFADAVANAMANEGKNIADFEYSLSGISDIKVDVQHVGIGELKIVAIGDNVSYIEFGVGEYAKGTYQGNLPKHPITFEIPKGKPQTTNGWEYYYTNNDTKKTIGGQHGWFIKNGVFVTGHPAGNQLFYTAKSLRENEAEIVKSVLKGDKK